MSNFTVQDLTNAIHAENRKLITSYMQHQDQWVSSNGQPLNINHTIEKSLKWCIHNNPKIFDVIFAHCPNDLNFGDIMDSACEKNRPEILKQLVQFSPNQQAHQAAPRGWEKALDVACVRGHVECMEILLSHGCKAERHGLERPYRTVDMSTPEALSLLMSFPEMDAMREQVLERYIERRAARDQVQGFVECLYDHDLVTQIYERLQIQGRDEVFDSIPESSPFKQRWNAECQRQALNAEVGEQGIGSVPRKL